MYIYELHTHANPHMTAVLGGSHLPPATLGPVPSLLWLLPVVLFQFCQTVKLLVHILHLIIHHVPEPLEREGGRERGKERGRERISGWVGRQVEEREDDGRMRDGCGRREGGREGRRESEDG